MADVLTRRAALISLVKNVVKGGGRGGGERQTRWLTITSLIYGTHVCFVFFAFYCILEILISSSQSSQSCDKDVGSVTPNVLARQRREKRSEG